MKLSCLPVSYFGDIIAGRMSIGQWAREAAEIGLDAIDLSIALLTRRDAAHVKTVREDVNAAGLGIAMVTTYPDFTHPEASERARQSGVLADDIAAAAALGAELVRVTAGQAHPTTTRANGIAWAAAGLAGAVPIARQSGVRLVYENHAKPAVWDYVDFSHPTDIFEAIVGATAGTGLGINFDTANTVAYGDDPIALLKRVRHRLVSVHIADTACVGKLQPVVVGTGVAPLRGIFRLLHAWGFDGWMCIEEASGTGRAGVAAAVDFVRGAWTLT